SLGQARGLDGKASRGIEHDDVGIAPGRDPSLAREAREPGGSLGAPAGEVSQVPAAVARSGPGGGEPYLERRAPAPRPHEVARVEALEDGGRGRTGARPRAPRRGGARRDTSHSVAGRGRATTPRVRSGRGARRAPARAARARRAWSSRAATAARPPEETRRSLTAREST